MPRAIINEVNYNSQTNPQKPLRVDPTLVTRIKANNYRDFFVAPDQKPLTYAEKAIRRAELIVAQKWEIHDGAISIARVPVMDSKGQRDQLLENDLIEALHSQNIFTAKPAWSMSGKGDFIEIKKADVAKLKYLQAWSEGRKEPQPNAPKIVAGPKPSDSRPAVTG